MWDVGVDGVTMSCCGRRGVIGNGVEVDHGVSGDHIVLLRSDVFRGSFFEVLGFLVPLEVVCWVVGWGRLKSCWKGVGFSRLGGTRWEWCGCRSLGGGRGGWCGVGDGWLGGR